MISKNGITRRSFVKKASAGLGALSLGHSSSAMAHPANLRQPQEKMSPREAWVLSISRTGLDEKDIIGGMIERIALMSSYNLDIICLPEAFANTAREAEEVPGPIINRFTRIAKDMGTYIICPIHAKTGDKVYNSAVLIDREGEIAGQYDKIHPVSTECKSGVTPGSSPPKIFNTDFGKIGIQICFDVYWVEEWRSLKEQGAEIVFWPSMFPGGRMLSALAWMYNLYVVGSCWRDPSTIHDITGDLIAESGKWEHLAVANLNMEKALLEIVDYSDKLNDIKKKYGRKVLVRYFGNESWVTIESRSPDLTISSILKEYELVPLWDYIKTEEAFQDKYRNIKG
jgi:predicted amidohydrolase